MNSGLPPARAASTSEIMTSTRSVISSQWTRRLRVVAVAAVSIGLTFSGLTARADSLDDQKKKLDNAVVQSKNDLAEYSKEAAAAAVQLQASQQKLSAAQASLNQANQQLAAAQAEDQRLAGELKKAQAELNAAKAQAAQARAAVAEFSKKIGSRAREQMQQRTGVTGIAILVTDTSSGDVAQKLQWSTTIFDSSGAQMDRLRSLQLAADAAQGRATAAEQKVAAARKKAADGLALSQRLQAGATTARNQVAAATDELAKAKKSADAQVSAEQVRQQQLQSEQSAVNKRIADRLAEQKRQAALKAAAERKAEEQRKAAAAAAAKQRAASSSTKKAAPAPAPQVKAPTTSAASNGLIYPVSAPITSPYGMRLHPILRVWKLHDGTDFGAGCGTPMRAAADGVVAERYYNAGYGNRLIIDHGLVNGTYLSTGYNHATNYIVNVGQHVKQGQVIGYVGTTGYSTGCHLHLMVWANGNLANPMSYF